MRKSDTGIFVGHECGICGKRVNVSSQSGYWRVDPKTNKVEAWHMACIQSIRWRDDNTPPAWHEHPELFK